MLNEGKKAEKPLDKIAKDRQEEIIKKEEEGRTEKHGHESRRRKRASREIVSKIEKTTKMGAESIKSHPYWQSLKSSSQKIKEKGLEQEAMLKKQSPKAYRKISNGFFYFFETLVGRIKLGMQYGSPSLDTLEKLARLKELGILTDEEFAKKKKRILDRI